MKQQATETCGEVIGFSPSFVQPVYKENVILTVHIRLFMVIGYIYGGSSSSDAVQVGVRLHRRRVSHTCCFLLTTFMKGALSSSSTTVDTCADEGVFSSTSTLTDGAWASFLFLIPASSRQLVVVVGHQDEPAAAARLSLSTPISCFFRTSFYIYDLRIKFIHSSLQDISKGFPIVSNIQVCEADLWLQ